MNGLADDRANELSYPRLIEGRMSVQRLHSQRAHRSGVSYCLRLSKLRGQAGGQVQYNIRQSNRNCMNTGRAFGLLVAQGAT